MENYVNVKTCIVRMAGHCRIIALTLINGAGTLNQILLLKFWKYLC